MSQAPEPSRTCWIYRSAKSEGMYLYLGLEDNFDSIPDGLLKSFGTPQLVMQLELHPERKLAREETIKVLKNLSTQGFHLQLPPQIRPELFHAECS